MGTKKEPSAKLRKGIHPGCICGTSAQLNKKIHIVLHLQIDLSARVCTFLTLGGTQGTTDKK